MAISKKVVFIYEGKATKGWVIESSHKVYKINVHTNKVDEIELKYDISSIEVDTDYHYLTALSPEKALKKYKMFLAKEEAQNKGKKSYLN